MLGSTLSAEEWEQMMSLTLSYRDEQHLHEVDLTMETTAVLWEDPNWNSQADSGPLAG